MKERKIEERSLEEETGHRREWTNEMRERDEREKKINSRKFLK